MENADKKQATTMAVASAVTLVFVVIEMAAMVGATIFVTPRLAQAAHEAGVEFEMSRATRSLVSFPVYWWPLLGLVFVGLVVKECLMRNKKAAMMINGVAGFATTAYILAYIWLFVLPLLHAMEASGG